MAARVLAPLYGKGAKQDEPDALAMAVLCVQFNVVLANHPHVLGLRTLLTLGNLKFDDLPLLEVTKPLAGDAGIMNEYVLSFLRGYKPITLLPVKPLHGALRHTRFLPPLGPVARIKVPP